MSIEGRKAARKAAQAEAEKKRKRALARLDGVDPAKPEPLPPEPEPEEAEASAEAEDQAFTHGSIPPMGAEEAFASARRALLDVKAPKERSEKARAVEDAVRRIGGFTWEPDALGLPPHLPVRPLGKNKSDLYFLDSNDEFIKLTATKLGQQGEVDNLFGPAHGYLWSYFGEFPTNSKPRIRYEEVRRALIVACGRTVARSGLFDPMRKVRGRGAWRTDSGVLVLHLGSEIWVGGQVQPLGEVEGHVYSRDVDLSPPADEVGKFSDELANLFYEAGLLDIEDKSVIPGRWLLKGFKTWNWLRPDLDPQLVLGYVVCVFLGAALKWRPAVYPIGDKSTGKSSLLAIVKAVLGDRLMDLADPTGPGIYQSLGLAAIGVWCDEFEQEGDQAADARASAVLRLARYASDGKNVVRGGAEGVPTNYQARGTFGFTGITPPPMKPAEVSRIAMPMLGKLPDPKPGDPGPPVLTDRLGDELGRHLLRRIVDRWHEWPDVLTAWRGVLMSKGHGARAADTFGTLLAAAHMVMHDGVPLEAVIAPMADSLPSAVLTETADDKANWEKCIAWLLQSQPDAWRTYSYRSVGEYLVAVLDDRPKDDPDETTFVTARDRLAKAGLALVRPTQGPFKGRLCLAVPNAHRETARLFEGSTWRMGSGAAWGSWVYALRAAEAVGVAVESRQRFDGKLEHCKLLALDKVIDARGDGEGPSLARTHD